MHWTALAEHRALFSFGYLARGKGANLYQQSYRGCKN
jgi:hypothetical protein